VLLPGRTPTSSQRASPLKAPLPKSSTTVNSPSVTLKSSLVTVPNWLPAPASSYSLNWKS